jgi:predicted acetyltransferase
LTLAPFGKGKGLKIRGYREEDRQALARLGVVAFGGNVADWEKYYTREENPSLDPEQIYVVEEDGEARASAAVLRLEVFVDGRAVPMGGVAAVKTHPAYRRRGYAGELMRAALWGMRERGTRLSMLEPFAHAFYRVYGWELIMESIRYVLKPTDLPTSSEQRCVRVYVEGDSRQMMELLEVEAARHPCCVRRGEKRWRRYLGRDDREAAVYEGQGGVEGYLLYKMSGWEEGRTPRRTLEISEFVAATPEARAGLLSFAAAQDPLVFGIEHSTPRGDPLHPYLRSSYVEARVSPEFMLRLVDVEGALELLSRKVDEPLVLEVADDGIPENAGEYTVGDGGVVRGAQAQGRIALDVRQLAQLYAGYLSARQLARHGWIKPDSSRALELLEAYFPAGDPWVFPPDHF